MSDRDQIRDIVTRALAAAGDDEPFTDGDSLVVSGRLGWLDVVENLTALEEEFGFEVHADEFDPMRFDSVDAIDELVNEVRSG